MPLILKRILNYLVMVLVLQIRRDKTYHQLNRLRKDLKTIPDRARQLTDEQLSQELEQPIAGCKTLNELLVLNAIHVPLHAGKIEEMARVLKQAK